MHILLHNKSAPSKKQALEIKKKLKKEYSITDFVDSANTVLTDNKWNTMQNLPTAVQMEAE